MPKIRIRNTINDGWLDFDQFDEDRTLTAGSYLSGGGDLSANRRFDVNDTLVCPAARALTGGTGIASIGDLSANRTVNIDTAAALVWTGVHSFTASYMIGNEVRSAASGGLKLYDDAGTAGIFVQDGGNVGIGTTAPASTLHIAKDGGAELNIANADATITKDDLIGQTTFRSEDTSTNGTGETSSIRGYASQTYDAATSKNREGYLAFYTTNNAGSPVPAERMRITNLGNVLLAASVYINWGDTDGTSGYGFKDNAGTVQIKNSGGAWANILAESRTLTGGTGIAAIGDLSANRTVNIDQAADLSWTGQETFSSGGHRFYKSNIAFAEDLFITDYGSQPGLGCQANTKRFFNSHYDTTGMGMLSNAYSVQPVRASVYHKTKGVANVFSAYVALDTAEVAEASCYYGLTHVEAVHADGLGAVVDWWMNVDVDVPAVAQFIHVNSKAASPSHWKGFAWWYQGTNAGYNEPLRRAVSIHCDADESILNIENRNSDFQFRLEYLTEYDYVKLWLKGKIELADYTNASVGTNDMWYDGAGMRFGDEVRFENDQYFRAVKIGNNTHYAFANETYIYWDASVSQIRVMIAGVLEAYCDGDGWHNVA